MLRRRRSDARTETRPTPDRIAADQLLDRARSLDRAGDMQAADDLRRQAAALVGDQEIATAY